MAKAKPAESPHYLKLHDHCVIYRREIQKLIFDMDTCVVALRLDKKNTNVAQITGSSTSIAGTILCIVGIAAALPTIGLSTILVAVGVSLGLAGAGVATGSSIWYTVARRKAKNAFDAKLSEINQLARETKELMTQFKYSEKHRQKTCKAPVHTIPGPTLGSLANEVTEVAGLGNAVAGAAADVAKVTLEVVTAPLAVASHVLGGIGILLDSITVIRTAINMADKNSSKSADDIEQRSQLLKQTLKHVDEFLDHLNERHGLQDKLPVAGARVSVGNKLLGLLKCTRPGHSSARQQNLASKTVGEALEAFQNWKPDWSKQSIVSLINEGFISRMVSIDPICDEPLAILFKLVGALIKEKKMNRLRPIRIVYPPQNNSRGLSLNDAREIINSMKESLEAELEGSPDIVRVLRIMEFAAMEREIMRKVVYDEPIDFEGLFRHTISDSLTRCVQLCCDVDEELQEITPSAALEEVSNEVLICFGFLYGYAAFHDLTKFALPPHLIGYLAFGADEFLLEDSGFDQFSPPITDLPPDLQGSLELIITASDEDQLNDAYVNDATMMWHVQQLCGRNGLSLANRAKFVRHFLFTQLLSHSRQTSFELFKMGLAASGLLDFIQKHPMESLKLFSREFDASLFRQSIIISDNVDIDDNREGWNRTRDWFLEFLQEQEQKVIQVSTGNGNIVEMNVLPALFQLICNQVKVPAQFRPMKVECAEHEKVDALPAASTCGDQLNLPIYSSKTKLTQRILFALCEAGFALTKR